MYCKNCGKQIGFGVMCKDCESLMGTAIETNGETFDVVKEVNNNSSDNGYTNNTHTNNTYTNNKGFSYNSEVSPKSKVAAGLFGIFLGSLGVHNFYLGYNGKAIIQLLMTILSCGMLGFISSLWGLIEGIMILTGNIPDANGRELKD